MTLTYIESRNCVIFTCHTNFVQRGKNNLNSTRNRLTGFSECYVYMMKVYDDALELRPS